MSTGCNCYFTEVQPNEWYYVLEQMDAPKNAWDWREYATAYGPFNTMDQAKNHLHRNHPNPGGYSVHDYDPGDKIDDVERRLFEQAPANTRDLGRLFWRY